MPPSPAVRRTLTLSILDGVFYSVMVGAAETYFTPYALWLGASNLVVGLLVALPVLVGSVTQLLSERLLALVGSRRRLVALSVALQAASFLPMAGVGLLETPARAVLFLAIVCAYWAFQLVGTPAWISLMGDLVPEAVRGVYFARRNRALQLATFLAMVAAGPVLTHFRARGETFWGFALVFAVALAARLASTLLVWRHYEPPFSPRPAQSSLATVTEILREPRHRLLLRYLSSMNFAVYLAAPFFAAYMLRPPERHGLGWSYATFTAVTAVAVAAKYLFLPLWGRAADRFGSRKSLVLSAWLVCALPLPWLFPTERPMVHLGVIVLAQVWSGLAWAGHELSSFNLLLDSAQPAERGRLASAMNAINGVMLFAGASLGALLVAAVPATWNPFLVVFIVSSAVRLVTSVGFLPALEEVRVVEHISYRSLFFRVVSIRPQLGPPEGD